MPASKSRAAKRKALLLKNQASEAVADTYSNPPARIGAGTGNQASAGVYPLTRFTQQYMTLLAMYRSHWIVRKVIDVLAEDMLKDAPSLSCELKPALLSKFDKVLRDTATIEKLTMALKWGRLFGGGVALICIDGHEDLEKPLKLDDVELDSYRGLIALDRWSGVFPNSKLITDMNYPKSFGLPESYACTFNSAVVNVHHTRLIRFTGRPLPEWEKQVEMYWGLSEIEVIFDELQKRDFASWNIVSLIARAQILSVSDEQLAQSMSGASKSNAAFNMYLSRMDAMAQSMNNQGLLVVGKDGKLESNSYSFGGLADLCLMQMADIAGAAEIPMSRLYGRTTSGLGTSGEGDLQIYYDIVESKRKREVHPAMDQLLPIICMSTFGQVPKDFDYTFPPVRTMDNKERSELAKSTSDAIIGVYEADLVTKRQAVKELAQASDQNGLFSNITDKEIEEVPETYASEAGAGELDLPMSEDPEKPQQKEAAELAKGKEQKALPAKTGKAAKDAEFEESKHPRADDGKFGKKGGGAPSAEVPASALAGHIKNGEFGAAMAYALPKGSHKTAGSFVLAYAQEGHSKKEIAAAASHHFGTKTSESSVNWYLNNEKKKTKEGQAAVAAKKAGIAANSSKITAAAAFTPAQVQEAEKTLAAQEKKQHKTMYVSVTQNGTPTYFKVSNVPEGLDNKVAMSQLFNTYNVVNVGPYDPNKAAPAKGYTDLQLSDSEVEGLKNAAYKKAQEEAAKAAAAKSAQAVANKIVTDPPEELHPAIQRSIKSYTNGSYSVLNSNLRAGQPISSEQAVLAMNLDAACRKSKVKETTVVYRGISQPQKFFGPNVKIGSVVLDNGFISTSKKESTANNFSGGGMVAKMTLPKGSPAIDVSTLSLHAAEKEVLLPRGAMFKIVSVSGKTVGLEYVNYE